MYWDWIHEEMFGPRKERPARKTRHSEVRRLVKKHGGGWHGPHVEHIDMTEGAFFKMIDDPEFGELFVAPIPSPGGGRG